MSQGRALLVSWRQLHKRWWRNYAGQRIMIEWTFITADRKSFVGATVISYLHKFCHNLKGIDHLVKVNITLSAPNQLPNLCNRANKPTKRVFFFSKQHIPEFRPWVESIDSRIPLSCGEFYLWNTGRCLNYVIREHVNNFTCIVRGHLGIHWGHPGIHVKLCSLYPLFK